MLPLCPQDGTMMWALRICVLAHRAMDVPKKVSLQAMLTLLSEFLREGRRQARLVLS